ncbi:MAG: hypothetical protein ABSH39_15040 [Candidatus Acidiferrum sp.]|jgi:hypothetical protein
MADLDLRPLSLGEILDRTFSLYRKNFLLFLGISAFPHSLILAMNLAQTFLTKMPTFPTQPGQEQFQSNPFGGLLAFGIAGIIIGLIVYMVAFLFSQGGTVFAVSELYLGRTTTIGASLGRMWGQLASLFGVVFLNGVAILIGFILFIVPGIYIACRLFTCIPAALLEDLGPVNALERSYALTKDFAGRSFLIYFLYMVLVYSAAGLFSAPFVVGMVFSMKNPDAMRIWMALTNVGSFVAGVLVTPFLTIATSVFYYDLRVRKEAFDLQLMMNPSGQIPSDTPGVTKMFS